MNGHSLGRVFDVGVFGAGYAGFAAAMALAADGKRVLLADLRGDLLWESGRSFHGSTGPWTSGFALLSNCMARITGVTSEWFDGGTAEVLANELLRDAGLTALYFAAPVGAVFEGGELRAVTVATKGGLRRIAARQWIDATESGALARLLAPRLAPRRPARLLAHVVFQSMRWPDSAPAAIAVPAGLPGCRLRWTPTPYASERTLTIDMPGDEPRFLRTVVPAIRALRGRRGGGLGDAFVSHLSFAPYPIYAKGREAASPAANLALAVPGLTALPPAALSERFELGLRAARELASRPAARPERSRATPVAPVRREERVDVAVAGLGTGGVPAALAAARGDARVMGFDMALFAGGVGVGAGIPQYYYGVPGGLQDTIDGRVRELMPLFASRETQPRGFHPDAKRVVLDELLAGAGVRTMTGAMLATVERRGGRVQGAIVATPGGPVRIRARAWIDATGDGDLCALAGARFRLGRCGDGRLHAHTQSCGSFCCHEGRLVYNITNRDSGSADPTRAASLTRARIDGIHDLNMPVVNCMNRLTYVAPLIGLRQGRRIEADYALTLDDLVERRRFDDAVGYTGAHYDNHARDYELESDDAFFYVACAGLWSARTACEIPYRILLPRGLDNVWLACRAAGVTEEAAHSFRMQRDIQRIGEVCGHAAALAAKRGIGSRAIRFALLKARLEATGALPLGGVHGVDFGKAVGPSDFDTPPPDAAAGLELWRLYRAGPAAAGAELRASLGSREADRSWRAAVLFAMWGDSAAEPRLIRAIRRREVGPEHDPAGFDPGRGSLRILPRWWAAVTLLRRCGGRRALAALRTLATDPGLPPRVLSALAVAESRIQARMRSGSR